MLMDRGSKRVWLTASDVASRWRMSVNAVLQVHMKIGGLRGEKVGNQWLIALSDLTDYEQHRLLPDIEGRLKKLTKLKKVLSQPLEVAA